MGVFFYYAFLFYAFLWFTEWGWRLADWMRRPSKSKEMKQMQRCVKMLKKKYLALILIVFLNGCCKTTVEQIEVPTCPPLLREATYKAMQTDERRDYMIAVKFCQGAK